MICIFIKFRWTRDNVVKHNAKEIYSEDEGLLRKIKNMTKSPINVCILLHGNWYRSQCEGKCFFFFSNEKGIERKRSPCPSLSQFHIFSESFGTIIFSIFSKFQHSMETQSNLCIYRTLGIKPNHRQWFREGEILKKINGSDVNSVIVDASIFFFFILSFWCANWNGRSQHESAQCCTQSTITERSHTHTQHTECNTFGWLLSFIFYSCASLLSLFTLYGYVIVCHFLFLLASGGLCSLIVSLW